MLRIALNGRFYGAPVTGVQRVAREIAARLGDRARVTLFVPGGVPLSPPRLKQGAVMRGILPGRVWEQIELPLRLRNTGCDVALHLAQAAPAFGGGPSVIMVHDLTPLTHPQWYRPGFIWWFRAALARPVRRAARVLVFSEWTRGEMGRVLGIAPERIDLVSQGTAPFDRPADPAAVATVRATWALPSPYLLATGGGDRRKNVPFLLDVLRRWPGSNPPALVVTGSPHPHLHAAESLPRHDDLPVHLLGRVTDDELRALYTGAAAFCFPSLAEGFGRPPLEAMGCGTPVLAADYATATEVLGDAAKVLPLDAALWARTLARVISNPAEQADLRERGRRRAARYHWDRAADQVLASCEQAAPAHPAGTAHPTPSRAHR